MEETQETKEITETPEEKFKREQEEGRAAQKKLLHSANTRGTSSFHFKHRYSHTRGGKTKRS